MIFIDNEKIVDYPCDKKNYLNQGDDINAYLIDKEVIKVFKPTNTKLRITKDFCDKLTRIKTKRILLPKKTLLDENSKELKAYSMDYIKNHGINNFLLLPKEKLLKEMKILKEDISILSDERILINDLNNTNNISFHNGIYLIDPGSYESINDNNGAKTYSYNLEEINNLLIILFENALKQKCKGQKKVSLVLNNIKENIYNRGLNPLDFLIEEINDRNILSFIEKSIIDYKKGKQKSSVKEAPSFSNGNKTIIKK